MKKIIKPVIITLLILAAGTAALIYFLMSGSKETGEFDERRYNEQSDQTDSHIFRSDMASLATELATEGDNKNVLTFDNSNAFSVSHSKAARERLDRLIRRSDPTIENPIIALNPYGTMPWCYYFYFKTPSPCMIRYIITVEDEKIADHIRYVNNGEVKNITDTHEFVVGGLIPGRKNFIQIELIDSNGSHRNEVTYQVDVPGAMLPDVIPHERGHSDLRLQNGVFFTMPKNDRQIYIYDNNGVMRGVVATESAHGTRLFVNDGSAVYQVSHTKVIRVDRMGQITGAASILGYGDILDFAYDGFENVIALVKKGKRYYLARSSMQGGKTTEVYKFDKGMDVTSIAGVSEGRLYVSLSSPAGLMRIKGLVSKSPQPDLVIGIKNDWKKTSVKKKVYDPTQVKKSDAATGAAAKEPQKDAPLTGWDMGDTVLNLIGDESGKASDVLTFSVVKDRLVHAVRLRIASGKKIKDTSVTTELDKETEDSGRVLVEWGDRGSCIIANCNKGMFEERDEEFKVTRQFKLDRELEGVVKRSLQGFCFY